ncbi:MAG: hypothetical protein BIFFINMI_04328 [Phycisphaerae bacterium]|nr:hypothetical protein [Phycisphaerae bacterium]
MRRLSVCVCIGVAMATAATVQANIIVGTNIYSSGYGAYQDVAVWRVNADNSVERLGIVDLDPLFGYAPQTQDVAILKSGQVAVVHKANATNTTQVSLLTLTYDSGGALTGATLDLTVDCLAGWTTGPYSPVIAPTADGGFVVNQTEGSTLSFFKPDGAGSFTESTINIGAFPTQPAGIRTADGRSEAAWGGNYMYTTRVGDNGSGTLAKLAAYTDTTTGGFRGDQTGVNNALLPNGWIMANYSGTGYVVFNDATMDGSNTSGIVGHLTNSDGSAFTSGTSVVALDDGRVVAIGTSGWNKYEDFYAFSLTDDPNHLASGDTVGAMGYDAYTHLTYASGAVELNYMRVAGDYMVAQEVPEPATMGLLLLGGVALIAGKARRRYA